MPLLKDLFYRLKTKKNESKIIEKMLEATEILEKKSEVLGKKIEDEQCQAIRNRSSNIKGKSKTCENFL